MDTLEKGWRENREEYLKKAYGAVRAEKEPTPLNEAVDNWDMLTGDASSHYFWKALGLFRVNDSLEIVQDGERKLLDIDSEVSLAELEEDVDLEPGDRRNVRRSETDQYMQFGDFEVPVVPTFIPWEHAERSADEVFPYEEPEMRGVVMRDTTSEGTEETWLGFYNHDGREEGSTWINQIFRGLELDDEELVSTEDIFSDSNRESYTDTIWESRPLKIRQRAYNIWDAAVEAVEEKIPEIQREYLENAENRGWEELDEFEVLKRELRLAVDEDEYDEENPTYIEEIVHDYYRDGLHRDSTILQPYLENVESTPHDEGDMNLDEATRESETSKDRKQRNQAYMSHYLDLVWQLSQERYGE